MARFNIESDENKLLPYNYPDSKSVPPRKREIGKPYNLKSPLAKRQEARTEELAKKPAPACQQ